MMRHWMGLVLMGALLLGCSEVRMDSAESVSPLTTPTATTSTAAALPPNPTATVPATFTPLRPTATPTRLPTPTPFLIQNPSAPCGQLLPVTLPADDAPLVWRKPFIAEGIVPDDALPAVEYLLTHPDDVALVAYRLDYEGIGFYHNADKAMPLASVVKLIHLIAYAQAVERGQLQPDFPVPLAELAAYYLPRSDLGSHLTALNELRRSGRLLDDDHVRLDDVVWMMMRHSANSATDYIHQLLGQATIEQTIIDLGMAAHSAPCPFLGQFLTMTNHTRIESDITALNALVADPPAYGALAAELTDRYVQNADFRAAVEETWGRRWSPSVSTQAFFVETLGVTGTAEAYAALMGRIVRGGLGSAETDALIRSHLEWPLTAFPVNQARYSVIGYKGGSLPGVLTAAYYAWPLESNRPMVVAVFYRNLPNNVYQRWRRTLPNDALAHWLMSDENAIHILHVLRDQVR